jgi:hypothetical protein
MSDDFREPSPADLAATQRVMSTIAAAIDRTETDNPEHIVTALLQISAHVLVTGAANADVASKDAERFCRILRAQVRRGGRTKA